MYGMVKPLPSSLLPRWLKLKYYSTTYTFPQNWPILIKPNKSLNLLVSNIILIPIKEKTNQTNKKASLQNK